MKIHMALTENDVAIISFKNALPERKFNETVIKILRHYLKGVIPDDPISFEIDYCAEKTSTKLDLPNDLVKQIQNKFKTRKGNFTTVIKQILKEYIKKNQAREKFDVLEISKVKPDFEKALQEIDNVKNLFADHPEKYKKQLGAYKSILNRYARH